MSAVSEAVSTALNTPLKLDIGCGKNKQPGFIGIDIYDFPGVDIVADLRTMPWYANKVPEDLKPRMRAYGSDNVWSFPDNSVDQVHCSHFLEHLTNLDEKWERVHFFNELYRIMKPGASAQLIFPHWASTRFYGDPTHKEPFSEMGFYYLRRDWRLGNGTPEFPAPNAPHADISVNPNGYACDFHCTWGYTWDTKRFEGRNDEYIRFALANYKDVIHDIHANIVKPA